jgi:hypothetical protein
MKKVFIILILFIFLLSLGSFVYFPKEVFSDELINYSVTISDSRPGMTNVSHLYRWTTATSTTLRCITLESCTTYEGTCNTLAGLNTTGAAKGAFSGLTSANWNLDATTNGKLKLTNAAGETPGANVSLQFSGIDNPTVTGLSIVRIKTFSDVSCSTQVDYGYASFQTSPGVQITAIVSPPPTTANLVFQGKASPFMFISFFKNGTLIGTTQASSAGFFEKSFTGLLPGNFTFLLYGEDEKGRRTSYQTYTLNLVAGTTTNVSGIFLSPTIFVSPKKVFRKEDITITGKSFPNSQVKILISPGNILESTISDSGGNFSFVLNTSFLGIGVYSARARALYFGEYSDFSESVDFEVLKEKEIACRGADLNFDGKVDIVDFSILMYFWGQKNPANRCANINQTETVDIVDFSIMMYQWTD